MRMVCSRFALLAAITFGLFGTGCGNAGSSEQAIQQALQDLEAQAKADRAARMVVPELGVSLVFARLTPNDRGGHQLFARFAVEPDMPVYHSGPRASKPRLGAVIHYENGRVGGFQDVTVEQEPTQQITGEWFNLSGGTSMPVVSMDITVPLWNEAGERYDLTYTVTP